MVQSDHISRDLFRGSLEAATADNLSAAAYAFADDVLSHEAAEQVARQLAQLLEKERQESARGKLGVGYSVDRCLFLVNLSLSIPSVARWSDVLSYIGDSAVVADHKESSVYRIVRDLPQMPEEVVKLLPGCIAGLRASRFLPANLFDFRAEGRAAAGLADYMEFSLGEPSRLESFVSFAFATSGGDVQMAWRLLAELRPAGYDLLALQALRDNNAAIRIAATRFVARRVDGDADTPGLRRAVERISVDGSVFTPRALLAGLTNRCPSWAKDEIERLLGHPAATVRALARNVLNPQS